MQRYSVKSNNISYLVFTTLSIFSEISVELQRLVYLVEFIFRAGFIFVLCICCETLKETGHAGTPAGGYIYIWGGTQRDICRLYQLFVSVGKSRQEEGRKEGRSRFEIEC